MVSAGVVRAARLFSVLWLCAAVAEARLSSAVLADILQAIRNRYHLSGEYAMALNIPRDQCNRSPDKDFLSQDTPELVNRALNSDEVYLGRQLIAVRPHRGSEVNDHAEHRLLVSPNRDGRNAPIRYLHRRALLNNCLVFFSTFSPCVDKCLNRNHPYRILNHLQDFQLWDSDWRAFAFFDIYNNDKLGHTRAEVLHALTDLHNTGHIPVYRCNRYNGQNHCFNCMDERNPATNACLYGPWIREG